MRIIAGEHRGRRLEAPSERATRPTTDRMRESLMSSVASARGGFDGARVLDPFAGSGALSFEALSRGADLAYLMDSDRNAIAIMKRNAEALHYGMDRVRIVKGDSFKTLPSSSGFDLVFLDPPYAVEPDAVLSLLKRLIESGKIADEALIVYEHDVKRDVEELFCEAGFIPVSQKSQASSVYDVFRFSL